MRRLALGALLLACGCSSVLTPPKPPKPTQAPRDIPEIPRSFALQQTTRRKVDGLKIRVYNTGSVLARGSTVSSMKSWLAKVKLDVPLFVVRHPKHGLIVFDTGLRPTPDQWIGGEAAKRLAADGFTAEQIRWVVASSIHGPPLGGFPNATTIVDAREWKAAKDEESKRSGSGLAVLETSLKPRLIDLSTGPTYGSFDHALDFFGDGTVFLIDLSGHSPGTLGLWVSLDEGPVLLAGDASWVLDNHQDLALPAQSGIFDINRYWRRLYQMKYMQEALPRLVIFPGHDLAPLKLQPRGDVTLAP